MNKEIAREEAIYRRADHWLSKGSGCGLPIKDLCRRHGFSEASYYLWRSRFGGIDVADALRFKALKVENTCLKKLLAESMLEVEVTLEVQCFEKVVTAPARREVIRQLKDFLAPTLKANPEFVLCT